MLPRATRMGHLTNTPATHFVTYLDPQKWPFPLRKQISKLKSVSLRILCLQIMRMLSRRILRQILCLHLTTTFRSHTPMTLLTETLLHHKLRRI